MEQRGIMRKESARRTHLSAAEHRPVLLEPSITRKEVKVEEINAFQKITLSHFFGWTDAALSTFSQGLWKLAFSR